jgi:hypothetical protein
MATQTSTRREVMGIIKNPKNESKSFWTRIGVAWVNKDGSEKVWLNYLPLNGEILIRDPKPKDAQNNEEIPY